MSGRELRKSPWWCICARRSAVEGDGEVAAIWRKIVLHAPRTPAFPHGQDPKATSRACRGNWGRRDDTLSCDLRLLATPVPIALPYIACDLPLVERRPPLVSQREIQEVSCVYLVREMGVCPPRGDHGLSSGAAWTIYTESIMSESSEGRGLAAVDDLLRSNHCSAPSLVPGSRSSNKDSRIGNRRPLTR